MFSGQQRGVSLFSRIKPTLSVLETKTGLKSVCRAQNEQKTVSSTKPRIFGLEVGKSKQLFSVLRNIFVLGQNGVKKIFSVVARRGKTSQSELIRDGKEINGIWIRIFQDFREISMRGHEMWEMVQEVTFLCDKIMTREMFSRDLLRSTLEKIIWMALGIRPRISFLYHVFHLTKHHASVLHLCCQLLGELCGMRVMLPLVRVSTRRQSMEYHHSF